MYVRAMNLGGSKFITFLTELLEKHKLIIKNNVNKGDWIPDLLIHVIKE